VNDLVQVELKALGICNENAEGCEVKLKRVVVDFKTIKPSELFSDGWLNEDSVLCWNNYTEGLNDTIKGELPAGKNMAMVFESNRWMGKVSVNINGSEIVLDLYKLADTNQYLYQIPHHTTPHHLISPPQKIFPKVFRDMDEKAFMSRYNIKEYHIDFFNNVSQICDFSDKTVLEVGGSNMPKQLTHGLLGAKKWVCVDKPWGQHFIDWPDHYGSIPIYDISEKKLQQALEEDDYIIFNCYAQDIPDNFVEQFDICISTCSFEHIVTLRTALKKIHMSLKPDGMMYTTFAPIWSSVGGSHYWIDNNLNFVNHSIIPNHAHLLKKNEEIYDILKSSYPDASDNQLEIWADQIKNGMKELNRLFFEDYEKIFYESPFSHYYMEAFCPQEVDAKTLKILTRIYPGYKRFDAWGIELYAIK
jgi:SAM-dependent methyltransferase